MILSKYPVVVQKEILDHMNQLDLLLLSFVSKKMKKLITAYQKNRSKSIRSIEYQYDRADGTCVVYLLDEIKPLEKYHRRWARTVEDVIMKLVKLDGDKNDTVQFNVLGNMIDFRFDSEYKYPIASYHEWDKESVFQSIHNHFLDIFGNSIEYNWESPGWRHPVDFLIPFIPKLNKVSFCIGMYIDGHSSDVRNYENFFSSSPVAKTIQLYVMAETEPLRPESKFYQAAAIHINAPLDNFLDFLSHFQGKQFSLLTRRYEQSSVVEFAKRWESGEAFQNLEFAQVGYINENLNNILNEIGVKFIDANRQPPTHTVRKKKVIFRI